MYISVHDLGLFVLFCLASAVCIYLIIVFRNLNSLLKALREAMALNAAPLQKTAALLPETVQNINDTAAAIREKVESAGAALNILEEAASERAAAVRENMAELIAWAGILGKLAKAILEAFYPDKKS